MRVAAQTNRGAWRGGVLARAARHAAREHGAVGARGARGTQLLHAGGVPARTVEMHELGRRGIFAPLSAGVSGKRGRGRSPAGLEVQRAREVVCAHAHVAHVRRVPVRVVAPGLAAGARGGQRGRARALAHEALAHREAVASEAAGAAGVGIEAPRRAVAVRLVVLGCNVRGLGRVVGVEPCGTHAVVFECTRCRPCFCCGDAIVPTSHYGKHTEQYAQHADTTKGSEQMCLPHATVHFTRATVCVSDRGGKQ